MLTSSSRTYFAKKLNISIKDDSTHCFCAAFSLFVVAKAPGCFNLICGVLILQQFLKLTVLKLLADLGYHLVTPDR